MSQGQIIYLARIAVQEVLMLSLPLLGLGLITGLVISIFQTTTSIQEQTLTFVPKMIAIFSAMILFSSWMAKNLSDFTITLFSWIPNIGL